MFIINYFNFVLLYFVRCNGFRTLQRFNVYVKHCIIYTNFHNGFCIGIVLLHNVLYSSNTLLDIR